jgi:hypothetical protein
MKRYYFDLREGDTLAVDDDGLELPNLQAVQVEAARSLVDMARHAVWTKADTILDHRMGNRGPRRTRPVLQAKFSFELERHRH